MIKNTKITRHFVHLILLALFMILLVADLDAQENREMVSPDNVPFNHVYLVASDVEIEDKFFFADITEAFDVQLIHSMSDVEMYEALLRIDSIFLHPSALDFVDVEWLQSAYERGVIITAFDIPASHFAGVVGDESLTDRYILVDGEIVFVIASQLRLRSAAHPIAGHGERASRSSSGSQVGTLSNAEDRTALLSGLPVDLTQIYEIKREFLRGEIVLNR